MKGSTAYEYSLSGNKTKFHSPFIGDMGQTGYQAVQVPEIPGVMKPQATDKMYAPSFWAQGGL